MYEAEGCVDKYHVFLGLSKSHTLRKWLRLGCTTTGTSCISMAQSNNHNHPFSGISRIKHVLVYEPEGDNGLQLPVR